MFALMDLHDYCKMFPKDKATYAEYQKLLKSLKTSIKYYDTGSWTRYNRASQELASVNYMNVHVEELRELYTMTHDPFFKNLANKWSQYLTTDKVYPTKGFKTYITNVTHITNPTFELDAAFKGFPVDGNDVIVIYRYANSPKQLAKTPWNEYMYYPTFDQKQTTEAPYYQFKVVYYSNSPSQILETFRVH